jgi:PAS domain S-box-containing protein
MVNISSRQALIYSSLIFLLSIFLNYFFSDQSFIGGGFIVSIFLTVFIEKKNATIIAALASAIASLFITVSKTNIFFSAEFISGNVFILAIIAFTAMIVTYVKLLLKHMQFDKTHMTSLFENATEGIILSNGAGKIVLVNPAAENIFGYKEEELAGQLIEVLIPRRFTHNHGKMREGFYQHPQNRQMGVGRELFAQKKDGAEFPVEVSLSYYQQNNEAFVIAFVVDITARKNHELNIKRHQNELEKLTEDMRLLNNELEIKVEERTHVLHEALLKLEQSQEELSEALSKEKQLNEIKTRFVSMASHEFRTPLSTVLSSASLLSKYTHGSEQEKREKHIHRIKASVTHLNDILEDFLSLGKLDEGKVSITISMFNLDELLQDVIEEMKVQVKNGQQIKYFFVGKKEFYSDNKLLRNISINLISNAIKFSDEHTIIYVDCSVENERAVISVKDEGIGISEEDKKHLFTSFFRGHNAANIQGTGMGLHIVKRYLDLLKGSITLHTDLQNGTTFTIVLPSIQQPI